MLSPAQVAHRFHEVVEAFPLRVRGRNPATVTVDSVRRFVDARVTGLAAEMTYYAILSFVPLITALGAGFGLLEDLVGRDQVDELEVALIDAMEGFFSAEVTEDIAAPLVEGLLDQQRTGLALGSLAVSFWLAGRIFRAAIRALDDAYGVAERRSLLEQWGLSLAFLAGSLVLVILSLALLVVGPLLGVGREVAESVGANSAADLLWEWGRWPVVALVALGFLAWLYRVGPNVDNTWRECLPGALVGLASLGLVSLGFQVYLDLAGPQTPDVGDAGQAVRLAAQLLGVALAALLYLWLLSISVLVGGVVNAEWRRHAPASTGDGPARRTPAPRADRNRDIASDHPVDGTDRD